MHLTNPRLGPRMPRAGPVVAKLEGGAFGVRGKIACVLSFESGMWSLAGPLNWEIINISCLAAAKQRVDTESSCSRASKSPGNDARVGAAWRSQHDPDQGSIIIDIDLAMLRPEDVPILVESSKARRAVTL